MSAWSNIPAISSSESFVIFITSHEMMKITKLSEEEIAGMLDQALIRQHRARALTPDRPMIRGTAQNPDVFFQSRERANSFYLRTPSIVEKVMGRFAALTGRRYKLFEFYGDPDAER